MSAADDDNRQVASEHDADLGPAPAVEPKEEPRERAAGSNLDAAPKQRINPKLGLQGMIFFMMDLRLRGVFSDAAIEQQRNALIAKGKVEEAASLGRDAAETWLRLEPADLEKLEDIADTLEYFRLERLKNRVQGSRR